MKYVVPIAATLGTLYFLWWGFQVPTPPADIYYSVSGFLSGVGAVVITIGAWRMALND